MRWCARCRRRLYDESAAFCPFDGSPLESASSQEPDADPYLGATLQGQFHLVAAIGSGAMGSVYRAWQSGMERHVAIKLLRADLLDDVEMRRRFLREGRAAARLNHPNIVSVYTVGETDSGVPYLVMEHLGGETLDELLDRENRLPVGRAVAIARQIASALAEAHGAGVVHRDLKPGNVVLLHRRGAGELVKIFDFGIAKIADGWLLDRGASRLTREGDIFGTPDYIAPEQAQGAALDGRADLYSLGILLYRMLSGRLPFTGNAVTVLLAHIGREPPDLAQVAPEVGGELAAVVMTCLAKDPARRFAGADQLMAALDRAVAVGAGGAPATARVQPLDSSLAQPIAPIGSAAREPGDAGASWTRSRPAPDGAPRASVARGGRGARAALAGLAMVVVCAGAGSGAAALFRRGGLRSLAAGENALAAEARLAQRVDIPRSAGQRPRSPSAPARNSVMLNDAGYAVRALLPATLSAGRPVELLFDVWDPDGAPVESPAIPVELAWKGSSPASAPADAGRRADRALAARPVADRPGRYRLLAEFPAAGEAALLLELAQGSSLHVHFDVAPAREL